MSSLSVPPSSSPGLSRALVASRGEPGRVAREIVVVSVGSGWL